MKRTETDRTHVLQYTKTFVDGALAGLSYEESMPCSKEELNRYLPTYTRREQNKTVVNPCIGRGAYTVSNVRYR